MRNKSTAASTACHDDHYKAKDGNVFLQDCQDLPRPVREGGHRASGDGCSRHPARGAMRHSRRCSITVIAAILLAAGWVAALLARSEGPPSAASVSEPRAAQTPASKPAPARGPEAGTRPASRSHLHRRRRLHRLPRRSERRATSTRCTGVPITRDRRRPTAGANPATDPRRSTRTIRPSLARFASSRRSRRVRRARSA